MTHWIDRLAVRTAADSLAPRAPRAADELVSPLAEELPCGVALEPSRALVPQLEDRFSRRVGLRTLGLAAGLLLVAPLRTLGPSNAGAATSGDCLPNCLAAAENEYREYSIGCNSGVPQPNHLLGSTWFLNPVCQVLSYVVYVRAKRRCAVEADCGRKKPPPPAPPPPKRGPPPPPPGGCGFQGLTSCGDTCCPAGSVCAGSVCIPPPPPPAAECKPACPPGKKCQNGQCVDASSPCGVCPPGSSCCTCSYGSYCRHPDLACKC